MKTRTIIVISFMLINILGCHAVNQQQIIQQNLLFLMDISENYTSDFNNTQYYNKKPLEFDQLNPAIRETLNYIKSKGFSHVHINCTLGDLINTINVAINKTKADKIAIYSYFPDNDYLDVNNTSIDIEMYDEISLRDLLIITCEYYFWDLGIDSNGKLVICSAHYGEYITKQNNFPNEIINGGVILKWKPFRGDNITNDPSSDI